MATDAERLLIRLEVSQRQFEKQMEAARRSADKNARGIESRFRALNKNVSREFTALGRAAAGAFAAAASLRGAQTLIDESIGIQNALKTTGLEGAALEKVFNQLFASAQRNSAPIEAMTSLFSRLALNQKQLGVSTQELVGFTDTIAMALRAGGTSAGAAAGALTQLSQALGGTKVTAEEFQSIMEGAPTIMQAAAAGIKQAEGSTAKLRQIMLDGNLSATALFRGIEAGAPMIEGRLASAGQTITQSFTQVRNELVRAAGRFNQSTAAADTFGDALESLADYIGSINFDSLIKEISGYVSAIDNAIAATNSWIERLSQVTELNKIGEGLLGDGGKVFEGSLFEFSYNSTKRKAEQDATYIPGGGQNFRDQIGAERTGGRIRPARRTVKPIDLNDPRFEVPADAGAGGGGGGRGGKGRAGAISEAEREREAVEELISSLQEEQTLITATDAERRITEALRQAGAAATDKQRQAISGLITEIEREKTATEGLKAAQEELQTITSDALHTIADGIRENASAGEIFGNVIDNLASKLIDMAIQNLVANAFGGAAGGIGGGAGGGIGGLLKGLFGGFRAAGGPISANKAYVVGERGPELIVPSRAGTVIPNHQLAGSRKSGSSSNVYNIDARGAQQGVGEEIRAALQAYSKGEKARTAQNFADLKRRGAL